MPSINSAPPDRIAVIGLGYVGLPLAILLAKKYPQTIGFDINQAKIAELHNGIDRTGEVNTVDLANTSLKITSELTDLTDTNFFIVAVPTPVDKEHRPDLTGAIVVYESTVYPGLTEEVCGEIISKISGLKQGIDFKLGYSPERINPGDKLHTLEKIVKVVAGEDPETLTKISAVYGAIIEAGVYAATSIKVAEMAKVIENTQRDLNIAFMNELALICDRLDIRTKDVLDAAKTKWNFLPFSPGLVGGHCIGVDPYYLTTKAESVGYNPQVILAGRRINDNMGNYLAQKTVKLLLQNQVDITRSRVGILGLTFKENVPDIRNSRVPDIIQELKQFNITPLVHDPLATSNEVEKEYGVTLSAWADLTELDAIILAVPHQYYLDRGSIEVCKCLKSGGVLVDVKSIYHPAKIPDRVKYWSL
jgi:UDP-N-acetyl-D-glucosamine/UDP-N-acetyl-D-galactosamine dehydrogenase